MNRNEIIGVMWGIVLALIFILFLPVLILEMREGKPNMSMRETCTQMGGVLIEKGSICLDRKAVIGSP